MLIVLLTHQVLRVLVLPLLPQLLRPLQLLLLMLQLLLLRHPHPLLVLERGGVPAFQGKEGLAFAHGVVDW